MVVRLKTSPSDTMCCCADQVSRLARSHASKLAAIARLEGASAADALDVVQDAFHTLISRADLRDDDDGAARLLATIVKNAARNHRRRHHRAKPHDDIDSLEIALADERDERPDAAVARHETAAQLTSCMAKLGDSHRHVVTLRVLEELSGDEAAAELGLTTGHVAVLLHRARKELERCMLAAG